jgi:5-methylthioribose kinase
MIDLNENSKLDELQKLSFWKLGEKLLKSSVAGPSNMNLVLRIQTDSRNVILKQSKPYVRKFPQILAPIDRIQVEFEFLKLLGEYTDLNSFIPKILDYDPKNHLLLMEDLGKGTDFLSVYSGRINLEEQDIIRLSEFLNLLHGLNPRTFPENIEMRKLNHEHIFHFPFMEENGFNLDTIQSGLQKISLSYKRDEALKQKIQELGKRYLSQGDTLIHGDFYPGSWLQVSTGIKIIDPEFGFMGDREFDLGVFLAHLDLGQQTDQIKNQVLERYKHSFDPELVNQYRGIEIQRRLIGIAQLPTEMTLSQKLELLEYSRNLILS